jgi:putative acetyltransferase
VHSLYILAVPNIAPDAISIVPYDDAHAPDFDRLNRAWLEEHGLLEEGDLKHLEHPRMSILDKGGAIFVALAGDVVVGTCGVVPMGPGVVELVKLAVDEQARGSGLGNRLSVAAIAWARSQGAQKLALVSSTKLRSALRLYERLGFQYGPLPADTGYETADVYMELVL